MKDIYVDTEYNRWSTPEREFCGDNSSFFNFFKNFRQLNCRFTTISSHFFCYLHKYLSWKRSSDGHFEVLNRSVFWLVHELWHKTQIFPFPVFTNFVKKTSWKCCNQIFSTNHRWLVPFKFCKWAHFNKYWMTEWNFDFPLQKDMRFSPRKWQLWHFGSIFMDVSYTLDIAI